MDKERTVNANFMVEISYNRGVVLCEIVQGQYHWREICKYRSFVAISKPEFLKT